MAGLLRTRFPFASLSLVLLYLQFLSESLKAFQFRLGFNVRCVFYSGVLLCGHALPASCIGPSLRSG